MIRQIRSIYLNCRHRLYTQRRRIFEAFGSDRYSRAGLDSLDLKLQKYLDFDNGFFIEAGANDGFTQSNTYWLERFRGWRGILVEPIPSLYEICRKERSRSTVYNYALVSDNWPQDFPTMIIFSIANLLRLNWNEHRRLDEKRKSKPTHPMYGKSPKPAPGEHCFHQHRAMLLYERTRELF
ncbi:MAG: hypothetical protein ACOYD3_11385 [Kiritimatiellia bacterium]|jgi:hypothetical protein